MSASPRHDTASGLRIQALDDARSSLCLFENEHYGNSAYLCQQSIEKTIKAVMVEYELTARNVKDLRHMPLAEMWDMMSREALYLASTATDEKAKKMYEHMYEINNIGRRILLGSTGSAKTVWWKLSLLIPLTTTEELKVKRFMSDFKKSIGQIIEGLNGVASLADGRRAKSMGLKHARNIVKRSSTELVKCLNELKRIEDPKDAVGQLMSAESSLNGLRRASSIIVQQQRTAYFLYYSTIMLMWSMEFAIPILKITPHEDMGRYPLMINGRKSTTWYKEKKAELQALEETIMRARDELIARMRPNARIHPTRLQIVRKRK